jgi:hypothetical protein
LAISLSYITPSLAVEQSLARAELLLAAAEARATQAERELAHLADAAVHTPPSPSPAKGLHTQHEL